MPLLTKSQTRTSIRQAIDDPQSKRWSDANIDILTTLVQDTMFQAVLDSFDYFTSAPAEAVTPAADGSYLLSGTSKRFYRMQRVVRASDSVELQPKLLPESVPQPAYDIRGNTLYTTPVVTGASSLQLTYSYLPLRFTDLANDATMLPAEYPEGHEAALVYLTASWAMTKGDAESMNQIARIADTAVDAMLSHIARRYPIAPNSRVQAVKAAILRQPLAVQAA